MGTGDNYASLNRLLARPMRRWWLRVGVWWLLAWVAVLLLTPLDASLPYAAHAPVQLLIWVMRWQSYIVQPLYVAAAFMFAALWLTAAWQALAHCGSMFEEAAAPSVPIPGGLMYVAALRQGLPLLPVAIAYALYFSLCQRVLYGGPFSFTAPPNGQKSWTIQWHLNGAFSSLTSDLVLIAVLVGLLAVSGNMRMSLIMLLAAKLSVILSFVMQLFPYAPGLKDSLLGTDTSAAGAWLGLGFLLLLLIGIAARRRWLMWSGYALLCAASLAMALQRLLLPAPVPLLPEPVRSSLWLLASGATRLFLTGPVFLYPDHTQNISLNGAALQIYPLLEAQLHFAQSWMALAAALLIDAIWVGLIVMLSWALLRHAKPKLA